MKKSLVIYNQISNAGRLDSWSSIFIRKFANNKEYNVYYLGNDIKTIKKIISDEEIIKKITFINFVNFKE